MSTFSARAAKVVKWSSVPVAVVASAALVWSASYSAFTARTDNPSSNWSAGTVALVDDDTNTALFSASTLKPGASGQKCVVVTFTGDLASTVKLYATNASANNVLADNINLTIEEGAGGSFGGGCAGFTASGTAYSGTLSGFASFRTGFGNGVGTWAPTGSDAGSRSYRFSYQLSGSTPDTAQGQSASTAFTWEAQNN